MRTELVYTNSALTAIETDEYNSSLTAKEIDGLYISANGEALVTLKKDKEVVFQWRVDATSNSASSSAKEIPFKYPARGNSFNVEVETTDYNAPATTITIHAILND